MNKEEKLKKIKYIADQWYKDRYENDWDGVNEMLLKIWELVNLK